MILCSSSGKVYFTVARRACMELNAFSTSSRTGPAMTGGGHTMKVNKINGTLPSTSQKGHAQLTAFVIPPF